MLASADGVVVVAENTQPDNRSFDQKLLESKPWVLFGNYVLVDYGGGRFGVYAHLQQGSVRPAVGERVHRGEAIARIGASGSAMFPHLHYQVQDAPNLQAEGLPSYFDATERARLVRPLTGDLLLARAACTRTRRGNRRKCADEHTRLH